jgi:hypothetical protein
MLHLNEQKTGTLCIDYSNFTFSKMRTNLHIRFTIGLLTLAGLFSSNKLRSQHPTTISSVKFPLLHEDFSLYDFAWISVSSDKKAKLFANSG